MPVTSTHGQKRMSTLDFDFDSQFTSLERDWRQAYDDSIAARAAYQALAARRGAKANLLDTAQERVDRTEEKKLASWRKSNASRAR